MQFNIGPMEAIGICSALGGLMWRFFHVERRAASAEKAAGERAEAAERTCREYINSRVELLQTERKADVELINVKLGQVKTEQDRSEARASARLRDLERIVGRAKMLTGPEEE